MENVWQRGLPSTYFACASASAATSALTCSASYITDRSKMPIGAAILAETAVRLLKGEK
ncbi:MAG: hypothetical protein KF726_03625 [Anaerolineae bacterium]|nr:hypothetical protein [Anaerolineae bacterium]